MITPKALVLREGERREIDSSELVPGDVVRLEQGKVIPADVRLVEVESLQVNESALTGESTPVNKQSGAMADAPEDLTTADQKSLAFMGTAVTSGSALAVVVETGKNTKIGEIAEQVREAGEIETPLKGRIRRLAKYITFAILIVAVIASGTGWLAGRNLYEMILLGVALFNCRSEYTSFFKKNLLENKVLLLGVLTSLGIHIAALYIPWTQELLSFTPLDAMTWASAFAIALTAILVNEVHKKYRRTS